MAEPESYRYTTSCFNCEHNYYKKRNWWVSNKEKRNFQCWCKKHNFLINDEKYEMDYELNHICDDFLKKEND